MIGDLSGIVQLWNDHIPHKKKKVKSVSIQYLWTGSLHKYIIDSDHLFLSSKRLWNAYIQFRGCDWWRKVTQVSSPQPKRGHRWSINQCPPWGAMQINKKGFFPSSVAGRTVWEDLSENPLKIPLSFTLSYIHIYKHITKAAFTLYGHAGRKIYGLWGCLGPYGDQIQQFSL